MAAFLCDLAPQIREYDYACFMHDKKAIQTKPGSVGASFGYVCNENICKNADYVLNVLTEFEKTLIWACSARRSPRMACIS